MQPRGLTDGHTVGHSQNHQSLYTLQRKLTSEVRRLNPKFWECNLEFVQQFKEQSLQPDMFFCASSSASLGRARYWQLALAQLDLLGSNLPDMICFNAVSSSAVNAFAWPFACKVLETATCRALEPSTETFRSLMGSSLSSSDWPLALHMLSDISAKRASTISAHISPAIDACGSAMWPAALHLFDSMKLFGVTFNSSHEGIAKVLGLNWAMSLRVTMHVPDCLADAALYRQALLSCLRSGELMQALRLLERCRSRGIQSTLAMRGAFLAACEEHGFLWQEALLVYHHSDAINGIDGTMSNSLLCMCRAHRQWQWSLRLFSSSACSATASASAYISSMGHVRRWESATDALAMLRTGTCQRLGRLGDPDWDAAIKSIGNAGANWRGSLQLLQGRIEKHKGTRYGFSAAMGVSQQGQQWIHAAQLLKQMQQGDLVPNAISYSTVAAAVQEFRHWEWTVNMLHLAPRFDDSSCHCFNALISCCEKARAWKFALQSMGHMQVIRLMPDGITFASGISACEKGLKWSFALHLLNQNCNPRPLDTERSIQGSAALSACARSSNWQMAMAVVGETVDPKRPEVLTVASAFLALNSKEANTYELGKARGWLNHVAAEAVRTNLDQTPRVRHRAAYMAAELLHEHDALPSSVAACISKPFKLKHWVKLKHSKLTAALDIWPPVPSWELRKQLEGWLMHDLQTEQPSWSTRRWLMFAKLLARRQSCRISFYGHEVFAELVACSTMASLPCYISTFSGARDKRHCQFQAGHSVKLTGHRREDGERGRLLIAVEGEGQREPHAERQALLDILCTLVELDKKEQHPKSSGLSDHDDDEEDEDEDEEEDDNVADDDVEDDNAEDEVEDDEVEDNDGKGEEIFLRMLCFENE
eukprot:s1218_g9.t1